MEDRAKLLANIEMDAQLEELRRKQIADQNQRVIAKPVIKDDEQIKPEKSSELAPIAAPNDNEPKISGGADSDPEVRKKRDHVKGVSK